MCPLCASGRGFEELCVVQAGSFYDRDMFSERGRREVYRWECRDANEGLLEVVWRGRGQSSVACCVLLLGWEHQPVTNGQPDRRLLFC